jgi:hypothetical protein
MTAIPSRQTWRRRIGWALVVLVLLAGLGLAVYHSFVRWQGNRFDLYPRWVGVRAMFGEGLSPYSENVALRSQVGMYGHPARPDEGESQHHFLYPAFIAFTIPHLWLPFPAAISAWIVTELVMLGLIVFMLASCLRGRLRSWELVTITVTLTAFRYNVLSLGLGQFTIYVLFYLVLAWWLWERGHDFWAGCALTQVVLKPQLVFLVIPLWVLLAAAQKRWRFVAGFAGGMALLIALPMPFIGNWLPEFLHPPAEYARAAGTTLLSSQAADALRLALSAILWPVAAWVWLRAGGVRIRRWAVQSGRPLAFPGVGYALALTMAITLVTTPRIRGYDLTMATLTLGFLLLSPYRKGWPSAAVRATAWAVVLAVPWVLSILMPLEQLEATERLIVAPLCLVLALALGAVRRAPDKARTPSVGATT